MIKQTVMEFILMLTVLNMRDNGLMTYNKVMELNCGPMEASMKGIIMKDIKMVKVPIAGQMVAIIQVTGRGTKYMGKENINGVMVEVMMEIGMNVQCMDMVFTFGQMVDDMRDNICKIRRKDMVYILGMMEENIKAIGRMVNRKVKEKSFKLMVK